MGVCDSAPDDKKSGEKIVTGVTKKVEKEKDHGRSKDSDPTPHPSVDVTVTKTVTVTVTKEENDHDNDDHPVAEKVEEIVNNLTS